MSCARPMATPAETPTPCSAKLTTRAPRYSDTGGTLCCRAESVAQQAHDGRHRVRLVRAVRLDAHRAAERAGQQHHLHNVASARASALTDQRDVAAKA